jgi:sugar (pentulose or hexulose) kinase
MLAKALAEYPLEQPQPGWHVQHPADVLSGIDSAVAECVARLGSAMGAAALGWYALGGASSLIDARAAVSGPRLDVSVATMAVTPLAVAAYALLRANVRALIDGYEEVAAMFASFDQLNSLTAPRQQEWPESS